MPTTPDVRKRRVITGVPLALALVIALVAVLAATGATTVFQDRLAGRPVALVEQIPGPGTGPVCPLDARYVAEEPDGLRPEVLAAWRRLAAAAGEDGVRLCLQDGKRSVRQQQEEFAEAERRFGTPELAARYVLPPDRSMHVKGVAVDVQPMASAGWVEAHGGALGWCRRYENEYWHFEYDEDYATAGCPALEPSATGY